MTYPRFALSLVGLALLFITGLAIAGPRFNFNQTSHEILNRNFESVETRAPRVLKATFTTDFATTAPTACSTDVTVSVPGAVLGTATVPGDACAVGVGGAGTAGSNFTCWVSATSVVTVRHCNLSTVVGAVNSDPASGVYTVIVLQ